MSNAVRNALRTLFVTPFVTLTPTRPDPTRPISVTSSHHGVTFVTRGARDDMMTMITGRPL